MLLGDLPFDWSDSSNVREPNKLHVPCSAWSPTAIMSGHSSAHRPVSIVRQRIHFSFRNCELLRTSLQETCNFGCTAPLLLSPWRKHYCRSAKRQKGCIVAPKQERPSGDADHEIWSFQFLRRHSCLAVSGSCRLYLRAALNAGHSQSCGRPHVRL
jgi:hypothetical protein